MPAPPRFCLLRELRKKKKKKAPRRRVRSAGHGQPGRGEGGGVEASASRGGRVKKAGRVLIFFTHFPLETPFLKAAVRPRSLRLSPRLTTEPRSLPHCCRWPPFTDPQPRGRLHIIRYFGLLFFFFSRARFFFLRKKKRKSSCSRLSETPERKADSCRHPAVTRL